MTGQEIVPVEAEPTMQPALAVQPVSLFGDKKPGEIVQHATEVANALTQVIKSKGLAKRIGNREYLVVEAWTLLGSMLGVFPVCEWTRQIEGGWEARVEARTLSGAVVGAAEAECLKSESNWKNRDDYALRSMAQTRATAKALRLPLGFIVVLAGFEATPADEMPDNESASSDPAPVNESQTRGEAGSEEVEANGAAKQALRAKAVEFGMNEEKIDSLFDEEQLEHGMIRASWVAGNLKTLDKTIAERKQKEQAEQAA